MQNGGGKKAGGAEEVEVEEDGGGGVFTADVTFGGLVWFGCRISNTSHTLSGGKVAARESWRQMRRARDESAGVGANWNAEVKVPPWGEGDRVRNVCAAAAKGKCLDSFSEGTDLSIFFEGVRKPRRETGTVDCGVCSRYGFRLERDF